MMTFYNFPRVDVHFLKHKLPTFVQDLCSVPNQMNILTR